MIHNNPMAYSEPPLPVGTSYTITSSGTWICPATGQWQIELHGGGGGGGEGYYTGGGGGGGSGDVWTVRISRNASLSVFIGSRGLGSHDSENGSDGGPTTISGAVALSCQGGAGGRRGLIGTPGQGGAASGSLATPGGNGDQYRNPGAGGYGNRNNRKQKYGNGGDGGGYSNARGSAGQPGAAILTYLGK